ncbi:MAG: immunoglobulin domain-containing protein [Verrucomicrobiaceae bacterium]|nr:immunoglobulin domain-containing protein [Verrucomicrobiaceae bacterium]
MRFCFTLFICLLPLLAIPQASGTVAFTSQPPPVLAVGQDQTAELSVTATGAGTISYQWFRNHAPVAGATAATYTAGLVTNANAGIYQCRVTDDDGAVFSHLCRVALRSGPVAWSSGALGQVLGWNGGTVRAVALVEGGGSPGEFLLLESGVISTQMLPTSNPDFFPTPLPTTGYPAEAVNLVQVAGGNGALIGLRSDGQVVLWRPTAYNGAGVLVDTATAAPSVHPALSSTRVKAVSMTSGGEALALTQSGEVYAWSFTSAASSTPAVQSGVRGISSGMNNHVAVKEDGSVISWGVNPPAVPADLTDVAAVAAGSSTHVALKTDGTLVSWGGARQAGADPALLSGVQAISGSHEDFFAFQADGTTAVWKASIAVYLIGYQFPLSPVPAEAVYSTAGRSVTTSSFALGLRADGLRLVTAPQGFSGRQGDRLRLVGGFTSNFAISYQWKKNDADIPGATSAVYEVPLAQMSDSGSYTVTATAADGSQTTTAVTVAITPAPYLTLQPPASVAMYAGDAFTLDTEAVTTGSAQFQWLRNGLAVPGATTADLQVAGFDPVQHEGVWMLRVTDDNGTRFSQRSLVARAASLTNWRNGVSASLSLGVSTAVLGFSAGDPHWVILSGGGMAGIRQPTGSGPFSFTDTPAVPSSLTGVVQAAARGNRCLAVSGDGAVSSWASITPPDVIVLFGTKTAQPFPVPGAAQQEVLGVGLGGTEAVAVKTDGSVLVWDVVTGALQASPAGLSNVARVSSGLDHHLALRADGTVAAWGDDTEGECQVPAGLVNVVDIAAGDHFSLALKSDGTVTAWGRNVEGQCNVPAGLSTVRTIAASGGMAMVVKADGSLATWGSGAAGSPDLTTLPAGTRPLIAAAVHRLSTINLAAGVGLVAHERLTFTQHPQSQTIQTSEGVSFVARVTGFPVPTSFYWYRNGQIVANSSQDLATGTYTLTYLTGLTSANAGDYTLQVSNGAQTITSQPATLTVLPGPSISTQSSGFLSAAENTSGTLTVTATASAGTLSYQWFRDGQPVAGATANSIAVNVTTSPGLYQLRITDANATLHSRLMPVSTHLWLDSWRDGVSALPWNASSNAVIALSSGEAGYAVSTSYNLLTIRPDEVLHGGQPWPATSLPPSPPPGTLSNVWVRVASRGDRALALQNNGRVMAWERDPGQSTGRSLPVPAALQNVAAISLSEQEGLALLTGGGLARWNLSDGAVLSVPAGLGAVASIASGKDHHLLRLLDGTVVALGDDSAGESSVPAGLTNVVAVAAGDDFSLALKQDGTVTAWGSNSAGQTTLPAGLTGIQTISASQRSAFAVNAAGVVTCWGEHGTGQSGWPDFRTVPATITPAVTCGLWSRGEDAVAVTMAKPSVPVITQQPQNVAVNQGANATFSIQARCRPGPVVTSWYYGNSFYATRNGAALLLSTVSGDLSGAWSVRVRNALHPAGSPYAQSDPFTFTVMTSPVITTQPTSLFLPPNATGQLSVAATSNGGAITYQWQRNGRDLPGATAATLAIEGGTPGVEGLYRVRMTNSVGSTLSWLVMVAMPYKAVAWDTVTGDWENATGLSVGAWSSGEPYYLYNLQTRVFEARGARGSPSGGYFRTSNFSASFSGLRAACRGSRYLTLNEQGVVSGWRTLSPTSTQNVPVAAHTTALDVQMDKVDRGLILQANGSVVWWSLTTGTAITTPGITTATAISSGKDHHLVLLENGTVTAFGDNGSDECSVPAGLANVVQVAAGDDFSLALLADGTVTGWGSSLYGETTPPAGLSGVARISASGSQAMAIRADGTLARWGRNEPGHGLHLPPASMQPMVDATTLISPDGSSSFAVGLIATPKPQIIESPQNLTLPAGSPFTLSIAARSDSAMTYQWLKDGQIIPGATLPVFTVSNATPAEAGSYTVTISNIGGTVTTAPGVVTLGTGSLTITQQPPATLPLVPNQSGSLSIAATASSAISYQWHIGTRPIAGATSATLNIPPLTRGTEGVYHCRVRTASEEKWSSMTLVRHPGQLIAWHPTPNYQETAMTSVPGPLLALGRGDANLAIDSSGGLHVIDVTSLQDGRYMAVPSTPLPAMVDVATRMDSGWGNWAAGIGTDGIPRVWKTASYGLVQRLREGPPATHGAVAIVLLSQTAYHSTLYCLRRDGTEVSWDLDNFDDTPYIPQTSVRPFQDLADLATDGSNTILLLRDGTLRHPTSSAPFPQGSDMIFISSAGIHFSAAGDASGNLFTWNGSGYPFPLETRTGISGYTADGSSRYFCSTSGLIERAPNFSISGPSTTLGLSLAPVPSTAPLVDMTINDNGRLLVIQRHAPPQITVQPVSSRVVAAGEAVWVHAQVATPPAGSPPVTWEWLKGDAVVITGPSLGISSFSPADAGTYRLRGTSLGGQVFSDPVTLSYLSTGIEITSQPQDQNVVLNTAVTLTATATGTQPLEWQWYRNGLAIPGATSASHAFTATAETTGRYQVRTGNATDGYRFSNAAFVRILSTYREWGTRNWQPNSPVVETALGTYSGLSLLPNGTVQKAGTGWTPTISTADNADIRAVFARGKRLAVLTRANKVTEWEARASLNSWELVYTPLHTQLEGQPLVQLALGERHTLALRQDGSVTAWAFTSAYGAPNQHGVLNIPAGLTDIAQIAAGKDHSVALRRDGTVTAWGRNDLGQCNVPAGLAQVVQIAANQHYTLALKSDGALIAWGSLAPPPAPAPAMPEDAPPKSPATEEEGTVTSNSTIIIIINPPTTSPDWFNVSTEIGPAPPAAAFNPSPIRISAGEGHCSALLADGSIRTWAYFTPYTPPTGLGAACAVAAGGDCQAALIPFTVPVISAFNDVSVVQNGTYLNEYSAALKVTATSAAAVTYVWKRGSEVVPGQNLPYLNFQPATTAHSGDYTVVVSNAAGSVESPVGAFRVVVPQDFSTWAGSHFTPQQAAAGQTGPTADPDARGIPNLLRYALGMNGTNPDHTALPSPALSTLPDGRRRAGITFCVPLNATGLSYSISVTSDMVNWHNTSGEIVPGPIIGDKRQYTIYDPNPPVNAATPRFIRLQVNATP